jgi:hypothetical protein
MNVLFIDESTIKLRTGISVAIDGGKQLRPMIKVAQDIFLMPALGSTLYKRLQQGKKDNNLNSSEVNLIDNYITDCLIWATISYLPVSMGYQFYSKGALQKTSEESNAPSKQELDYIGTYYQDIAESYKQTLINYLRQNYTLFAEYSSPGTGWDVVEPITLGYECPIFLEGDKECKSTSPAPVVSLQRIGKSVYTAIGGEASFNPVPSLEGKVILIATRAGWVREVVETVNTDTMKLQIVANTVTLPDIASPGERFEFVYT